MADAQHDGHLAEAVTDFTATRRQELRTLLEHAQQRGDLDLNTDINSAIGQIYGFLWYRLLVGHAPLDQQAADELANSAARSCGRRKPS